MGIVVDPFVLMISSSTMNNMDAALAFVSRLKSWDVEFIKNGKEYALSQLTLKKMKELGFSPTRENLASLLKRFNISHYSVQDLSPTCDGLMANAKRIEDIYYNLDDEFELVQDTGVVIPDEIRERLPEPVAKEFIDALCITAYVTQFHPEVVLDQEWCVVTAPLSSDTDTSIMITKSQINKLDDDTSIILHEVERKWPLLFDPEHIHLRKDLFEVFMTGDLHQVIEIARCKIKKRDVGLTMKSIDYSKIKFHDRFFASLKTSSMMRRASFREDIEKVFDSMVYSLIGYYQFGGPRHHALREYIDRNSEQRLRKRKNQNGDPVVDKAVRIQVVNSVHPLRIHYWHCSDGVWEFSNVTDQHHDNKIHIDSGQQIVH